MNILIPHSWLLEHLDTTATEQEIQQLVSLSGPSIERIHAIDGESVYDIEVTTNRVDSMSVRGIAREAAVILSQAGHPSSLKHIAFPDISTSEKKLPLPTIRNDEKLCKRIMCIVIEIPEKMDSPSHIQKRLKQIDQNTHDAVIDITNYITHELGHPCHAFDYDKIMRLGGVIQVERIEKGKKFTTLDGMSYTTVGGEVVYTNDKGEIIDLPGIKGTANTAMSDDTKRVLFWIESVDPKSVRFGSMTHAIRTVAAQLNEKNIDPHLAEDVFRFGVSLLTTFAHGTVCSELYDFYPHPIHPKPVTVSLEKISTYLGIQLPPRKIDTILTHLGCQVEYANESFHVIPPTFRSDLEIDVDIIEEVARIYGYHNLPSVLMPTAIPTDRPTTENFRMEHECKQFLATVGALEVYTYSLIDEKTKAVETAYTAPGKIDTHVKLLNPLTEDLVYLRRTLWASHVNVLGTNQNRKNTTIFEFANVYIPTTYARDVDYNRRMRSASKDKESTILPYEEFHLTITSTAELRQVKGMVEALAKKYFMPTLRYVLNDLGTEVQVLCNGTTLGTVIQLPSVSIVDIDWRAFIGKAQKYPLISSGSKFTPILEDLTITVPEDQHIQRVMETIMECDNQIVDVSLKDLYKRNATFTISYASATKQLNSDDAMIIRRNVVERVKAAHKAMLVGTIQ